MSLSSICTACGDFSRIFLTIFLCSKLQPKSTSEGTAFMQLIAAGPPFEAAPSNGFVVLVVIVVVGILVVGGLIYTLSKNQGLRRRFYRASKVQIAKENAEFSSDSDRYDVVAPCVCQPNLESWLRSHSFGCACCVRLSAAPRTTQTTQTPTHHLRTQPLASRAG